MIRPIGTLVLLLALALPAISAPRQVIIGVVFDGQSSRLDQAMARLNTEIQALTSGEFIVRMPVNKRLHGNWQHDKIRAAFSTLYKDPDVDIVIALGFGTAPIAVGLKRYPKPTLAAIILDESLANAPRQGDTSGVHNLTYISIQADLEAEIKEFQRVAQFKKIAILTDTLLSEVMPNLQTNSTQVAQKLNLELMALSHDGSPNFLDQLPADIDAVMIGPMPRMDDQQHRDMLQQLIELGLPSYSFMGSELVEEGALMTALPKQNWQRRLRHIALQVQGILLGENPKDMTVTLDDKRELVINMKTAQALGLSPSYDVLFEAQVIQDDAQVFDVEWTLKQVALETLTANLDILAANLALKAGQQSVEQARAALFPQLSIGVDYSLNSSDNPAVVAGGLAEHSGTASLNLTQILYNDDVSTNLDVERNLQAARTALTRQTVLDSVQSSTVAFLTVLNARSQRDISRETLKLSRSNLGLAQEKSRLGLSSNADVYRWESEVANNKTSLLSADSAFRQSKEALNRRLNRPITEKFRLVPSNLADPALLISEPALANLIENNAQFIGLGNILIERGLTASPEIANLKAQLAAQKQILANSQSSRLSPTVSVTGSVFDVYESSIASEESSGSDWRVGLNLSIPLYEGGGISHNIKGNKLTLQQFELELVNTRNAIEQNIRAQLHRAQASKLSIELTQDAAIAARKNLTLILEGYGQGAVGIIDLVDAQNASTSADLAAAQSVYQFLIDLMNLQRSTGTFDFFLEPGERQSTIQAIQNSVLGK